MVTKQQQLEWMAKEFSEWPGFGVIPIKMSHNEIGSVELAFNEHHKITKQEWQQERDKMNKQDNSWHERGELPPVGCAVDVTGDDVAYGYGESDCEVLAHVEDCAVIRMSFGLGCFVAKVLSPSRTERERAIDEMISVTLAVINQDTQRKMFGMLYDAGYRNEQSK